MNNLLKGSLALTIGLIGLTGGLTTAHAATKSPYLDINHSFIRYVQLKKNLYIGAQKKSGKTFKRVQSKKGTIVGILGMGYNKKDKNGNWIVNAGFTNVSDHYGRIKNLTYKRNVSVPLKKANFKIVKLGAEPTLYQAGKGFKGILNSTTFTSQAAFYLTMDHYVQYYNASAMKKFAPDGAVATVSGLDVWKPTHSAKAYKVTTKGRTTKIYTHRAIKGLPNKRLAKGKYRLTIKDLNRQTNQDFFPFEDAYYAYATWSSYRVNGKPYFSGTADEDYD
ncbi:hypothetical protein IV54_GL001260 [Levilactobacillus paucivorans]|uniref:Surface layer protein A domain-containing protein n=1 Tax=Levilactobacillus paucivorans TaxID=616990 RepID=A0A0R2LHU7_9LACO|nr:hypothetical protein [Levilactobacillus paucivorans]KRN97684.1 hypothetical protein IV54_GL001260 [Levilactobacillus paucivorans]